jgi:hypothetical protein
MSKATQPQRKTITAQKPPRSTVSFSTGHFRPSVCWISLFRHVFWITYAVFFLVDAYVSIK